MFSPIFFLRIRAITLLRMLQSPDCTHSTIRHSQSLLVVGYFNEPQTQKLHKRGKCFRPNEPDRENGWYAHLHTANHAEAFAKWCVDSIRRKKSKIPIRQTTWANRNKNNMLKAFKHNCPLIYIASCDIKQIDSLYPFIPRHPVIPPQKVRCFRYM